MPARRKAGQNKATKGRQKRALKNTGGTKTTAGAKHPSAAAIRAKTPTPRKQQPARDSVSERRKRGSGRADSAYKETKPASRQSKPHSKEKSTTTRAKTRASGSGQKPAQRKRAAAPTRTRARKQNTGGKQAKAARRETRNR